MNGRLGLVALLFFASCYISTSFLLKNIIKATSKPCSTNPILSKRILHNIETRQLHSYLHLITPDVNCKNIVIVGAGWGGLSAAHHLTKYHDKTKQQQQQTLNITVVDASPRVGGLVRDGYPTINGTLAVAEAGQHGFWDQYHNIFHFLETDLRPHLPNQSLDSILTHYAPQGQYSPKGLEAVWPIYRQQMPKLPTGLAQAAYTKFINLPLADRISAFPLVAAFNEFDDSPESWKTYDNMSFRDLCVRLGISKRCYDEAFEPMILTGLFAPGAECSAAAALGMAYFFVLANQNAFDVRWCKGNIGTCIMDPWVQYLKSKNVTFLTSTKVHNFEISSDRITSVAICKTNSTASAAAASQDYPSLPADEVVLAVGAKALNGFATFTNLSRYPEYRRFANLRGTSVLATRLILDGKLDIPYSANACWGFDKGVGMTFFDITTLHGNKDQSNTTTVEVDFYHASTLLPMSDEEIVIKVKNDLNTILGQACVESQVLDAAIIRLPNAVNWYFPGSYADMPEAQSVSLKNLFFCGDIVKTRHGSWSQEKAFVTGMEAANIILKQPDRMHGIIPLVPDEAHVKVGRTVASLGRNLFKQILGLSKLPSIVDFL